MEKQTIQAVLFDMDGTLADTDPIHVEVWKNQLKDKGIDVDKEYYRKHISGFHNHDLFRQYYDTAMSDVEAARRGEAKEAAFREMAEAVIEPISGLVALLDALKVEEVPMYCVTNAPRTNAEWMVRVLKLSHYFQGIVVADECPKPKPHPDPYLEAMRRLNVHPSSTIVFEDSPTGVRSGASAGCTVIGIASSQPKSLLIEKGCAIVVDTYEEVSIGSLVQLLTART